MKNKIFILYFIVFSFIKTEGQTIQWPVSPTNSQGNITGTVGEYRPIRFHMGVDITGNNRIIYAINAGTVTTGGTGNNRYLLCDDVYYYHVLPNQAVSDAIDAGQPLRVNIGDEIGTMLSQNSIHVHLENSTINYKAQHLSPYIDNVAPYFSANFITNGIQFYRNPLLRTTPIASLPNLVLNQQVTVAGVQHTLLYGKVDIAVHAIEPQTLSSGASGGGQCAPNRISWVLRNANNQDLIVDNSFDFTTMPENDANHINACFHPQSAGLSNPTINIITASPNQATFDRYLNTGLRANVTETWPNNTTLDANYNGNAQYPDGTYQIIIRVSDVSFASNPMHTAERTVNVLFDNCRPFIQRIEIRKNTANGDLVYTGEWTWNGAALTLTQQDYSKATENDDIWVKITTSEPLTSLSLNVLSYNQPSTTAESTDGKTWVFTIPKATLKGNTAATVQLSITGTDKATHPLQVNANDIPLRDANGDWPATINSGADITHRFGFTVGKPELTIAGAPIGGSDLAEGCFPFSAEIKNVGAGDFNGTVAMVLRNTVSSAETEIAKETSITIAAGEKFILQNLNYSLTEGQYQVITRYTTNGSTWVNVPGAKNPYALKITKLGGVDFTNATMTGISIDALTNTPQFIFKGQQAANPVDPKITEAEAKLLQRTFIQALKIPDLNQWISLDPDPDYNTTGNSTPHPVSSNPFKNTKMANIMFDADVKLKFFWDTTFRQNEMIYWSNLVKSSRVWTTLRAKGFNNLIFCPGRACIIPGEVTANASDGNIYVNEAKLSVESENYNCCFINNTPLPLSKLTATEHKVLDSLVGVFSAYHTQHLLERNKTFPELLNSDPKWETMRKIYPAMALAHWYKKQPVKDPYLESIIDSDDISSETDTAFTQQDIIDIGSNYNWDFLVTSPRGKTLHYTLSGGNNMKRLKTSRDGPLNTTQEEINNEVINQKKSIIKDGALYFSGGKPTFKAPDLYPNILSVGGNIAVLGDKRTVKIQITNSGNKPAENFKAAIYYFPQDHKSPVWIGDTLIAKLDTLSTIQLKRTFTPFLIGKYRIVAWADGPDDVNETVENNNIALDSMEVKTNIPSVTILSPKTGSQILQSNVRLKGVGFDSRDGNLHGTTLTWKSDRSGTLGTGDSIALSSLAEGIHKITLTAVNSVGKSSTSQTIVYVFVPGKPLIKITSPINSLIVSSDISLNFTATAIDYSEGKLNNVEWWSDKQGLLGKGDAISAILTINGVHRIIAKAINSIQQWNTDTIEVTVVEGHPSLKLLRPTESAFPEDQFVEFFARANDLQDGDISSRIKWASSIDGVFATNPYISKQMKPGLHSITASVTDNDGLTSDTTFTIQINYTPPIPRIISPKSITKIGIGQSITLQGLATDSQDGELADSKLTWSSSLQGYLGKGQSFTCSNLSLGSHDITLTATDSDNKDSSVTMSYIFVGQNAPVIQTLSPRDNYLTHKGEPVQFNVYAVDDQDGVLYGNAIAWTSSIDGKIGTGGFFIKSNLSAGQHLIRVTATDKDGNYDTRDLHIDVLNSYPPLVQITSPGIGAKIEQGVNLNFEASVIDKEQSTFNPEQINWYSNLDGLIGIGKSFTNSKLSIGMHQITCAVTDSSGEKSSAISSVLVTQKNPVPRIISPDNASVFNQFTNINFTGAVNGIEDLTLAGINLEWTSSLDGRFGSSATINISSLSVGTHIIRLTATDKDGGIGFTERQISIFRSNPPTVVITNPKPNAVFAGHETITFTADANDIEDGIIPDSNVKWSADFNSNLGTGKSIQVSNVPKGNHKIFVTATDNTNLSATGQTQITVLNNIPVVSIQAPTTGSIFHEGEIITFTGISSDVEDGVLSGSHLSWYSDIDGLLGTGLTLISPLSIGSHRVRLTATDNDNASSYSDVNIKVNMPQFPSLSIINPRIEDSFNSGTSISFKATAKDYTGALIDDISWVSNLDGLLGNGKSLTLNNLSIGDHIITITAKDQYGLQVSISISLQIVQNLPTVQITSPINDIIIDETTQQQFSGSAIDPEDGVLTGSSLVWESDKDGLLGTGTYFYKSLTPGYHTVTLTATDKNGGSISKTVKVNVQPITGDTINTFTGGTRCISFSTPNIDNTIWFSLPKGAHVNRATLQVTGLQKSATTSLISKSQIESQNIKDFKYDSLHQKLSDSLYSVIRTRWQIKFMPTQIKLSGVKANVPSTERQALVDLYNSTNGSSWTNKANWLSSLDVSLWNGVTVVNGHVVSIKLYSNKMSGILPASISNLIYLEELDLANNSIGGSIPTSIGSFARLKRLALSNNKLTGNIPSEIYGLTTLQELDLMNNQLTGILSANISRLINLKGLTIGRNQLTGALPSEIGALINLEALWVDRGGFTGPIPETMQNLTKLQGLWMGVNSFDSRNFPSWICNFSQMQFMDISNINLTGIIPPEISNLKSLQWLYINNNKLSGDIPTGMVNDLLYRFFLNDNYFSGLPLFKPNYYELHLANNNFTFEDFEQNKGRITGDYTYIPQRKTGTEQTLTAITGTKQILSVSVGGANNRYQWRKNGINIAGANSSNYTINSVSTSDAGDYDCVITNTSITDLTLYNNVIHLQVSLGYPTNPTIDVGANSSNEWSYSGTYSSSQTTPDLAAAFNAYPDITHVPVRIRYSNGGVIELCDVNIQYTTVDITPPVIASPQINPNPVMVGSSFSVSSKVTDNINVKSVKATYNSTNYEMNSTGNNLFVCSIPANITGINILKITAIDINGLQSIYELMIKVYASGVDFAVNSNNITLNPSEPRESELVFVKCPIRNNGNTNATNVAVALLVNGIVTLTEPISIGQMNEESTHFIWKPSVSHSTLSVVADYDNKFPETDETNNTATINVKPKDITPPVINSFVVTPYPSAIGQQVSVTANATDNAGIASVTCIWDGSPIGLTYNSTTGNYEGIIQPAVSGTSLAICIATDINGLISQKQEYIKVLPLTSDIGISQSDIQIPANTYSQGQTMELNLLAHNYGGVNISCSVVFLVDGKTIGTKKIHVGVNCSVEIPFSWVVQCGEHTFSFILDENNQIAESNENNNTASIPVNFCVPLPPVISNIAGTPNPVIESDNFTLIATIDFANRCDSVKVAFKGNRYTMANTSGNEYSVTIPAGLHGDYQTLVTAYDANGQSSDAQYGVAVYQKKRDLWLNSGEIAITPSNIKEGDQVSVSCVVHNTGNQNVLNALVYLYANSEITDSTTVSIAANGYFPTAFSWQAQYQDQYLKVVADPRNQVIEEDETNNSALLSVTVADNTPPVITGLTVTPNPAYQKEQALVTLTATDNVPLQVATYTWKGSNDTLYYNAGLNRFETTISSEETGTYLLETSVKDITGFESQKSIAVSIIPQLADLAVSAFDLSWDTVSISKNDTVQLYLTVHNNGGTVASNAEVRFKVDGVLKQSLFGNFSPYSQQQLTFKWPALCGKHDISFTVDEPNSIPEKNENNNTVSQSICFCNPMPPLILEVIIEPNCVVQDSSFVIKAKATDDDGINQVLAMHQRRRYNLTYNSLSGYYEAGLNNNALTGSKTIIVQATDISGLTNLKQAQYISIPLQPDLSIASAALGQAITIADVQQNTMVAVSNTGGASVSNVLVQLYVNSTIVDSMRVEVPGQGSTSCYFSWLPIYGSQSLKIVIDPANEVIETNEGNNQWERVLNGVDNQPPVIQSVSVSDSIFAGKPFKVTAVVTDNISVSSVNTFNGRGTIYPMVYNALSKTFTTSIPYARLNRQRIDIIATDISGLTAQQSVLLQIKDTLPDIEVKPYEMDVQIAQNNEHVSISSRIRNTGSSAVSNVFVRLLVDGMPADSITVSLPKGGNYTWSTNIKGIAGNHRVTVIADPYKLITEGDETNNIAERDFNIYDITPPASPVPICNPSDWSKAGVFKVYWNRVTDPSGIKEYWYNINNEGWIPIGTDTLINLNLTKTGEYQIQVKAEDIASNLSEPGITEALFDNANPEIPALRELHCGSSWTTHNSPMLSWNNPGDEGSGISNFRVLIDSKSILDVGNVFSSHLTLNRSGEHTFKIKAIDRTGNESDWSNEVKVWIDLNSPSQTTITSTTHPVEHQWYNLDSTRLLWSVPHDTSYVKGYYYLLNRNSKAVPHSSSFWYTDTTITLNSLPFVTDELVRIPEGKWYFHLASMDAVGNIDSLGAHYEINIDRSAPQTIRVNTQSDEKCKNIITIYAEDYYSGVNKTFFRINHGEWKEGTVIELDKAGENLVEYYSTDNAGNTEEVHSDTILNTGLVLSRNLKNVSCPGKNDGAINVTVEGGKSPYIYHWSNNATSKDLTNLTKGIYELTITDQLGCTANLKDTITEPLFYLNLTKIDDLEGKCQGEAKVAIIGGTPPFLYNWKGACNREDSIAKQLCAGTYTVMVTDAKKCTITSNVIIAGNGEGCYVFPNPTQGKFTIMLPGVSPQRIEVTLLSMNGKTIFRRTYSYDYLPIDISIKDMPNKLYILKVKLDNKKYFIRKIIKIGGWGNGIVQQHNE